MKQLLLSFIAVLASAFILNAQTLSVNFSSTPLRSVPADWLVTSSVDVAAYKRPYLCAATENGLVTPGVGQTAPLRLILPSLTFDGVNANFVFGFNVSVLDPNLNCSSAKEFECATYVKAYLVDESWFTLNSKSYVLNSSNLPPAHMIYEENPNYQILNANDYNTVIFNVTAASFTIGKKFRVLLDFKAATSTNCSASGTKFVFDDFSLAQTACITVCPPIANNDYFKAGLQNFTNVLKGNLFGGNTQWSNEIDPAYKTNSLPMLPAIQDGVDYDANSTPLSSMEYSLVPGSVIVLGSCPGTNILPLMNPDGTFILDRGNNVCASTVIFQYTVTNKITNLFATATVTVDFPSNSILPVSFKSFTATRNKQIVSLKWETTSEVNNRGFYVQRNTDGAWKDIAFVPSAADGGNSSSLVAYQYNDLNAATGVSQYRISQVDLDGRARFSEIRSVSGELQISKIVIYPNPSSDGIINIVFDEKTSVRDITVSDMSGRIVKQWQGITKNNLVIDNLQNGLYNIQVTDRTNATTTVDKFIVQKR